MVQSRGKLVIVANRGPYRETSTGGRRRLVRAAGGLVAALDPVLRNQGGLWVSAQDTDHPLVVDAPESIGYDLVSVALKRSVQQSFYGGFSNAVLWPLLTILLSIAWAWGIPAWTGVVLRPCM